MKDYAIKSLKEMEGDTILLLAPLFGSTDLKEVHLHRVEDTGIWIESQESLEVLFANLKANTARRTMVFFLPWHQVTFVMGFADVPAISEKGLGL